MSIIDISVPLYEGMTAWPGSIGLTHKWVNRIAEGRKSNDSTVTADVHLGTHVDAPLHFVDGGESVEKMPLDILCGQAFVAELPGYAAIGAAELSSINIPETTERLLLKTDNSRLWEEGRESTFKEDFVALTEDGAEWIVEKKIKLIGIDYISIGPYPDGQAVHVSLLKADIVIVEGLNLLEASEGGYELICLPLKIRGAEGAPARAILRSLE